MSVISHISIDEADRWDQIVRSFKQYDVYYLNGYAKTFQIHGDGEPSLFLYESDGLRCINVSIKRDIQQIDAFREVIPPATYFDLITPYGYGGFLFEGNLTTNALLEFKEAYLQCMQHNHIVSEFVRYHPLLENASVAREIFPVEEKGRTIYLDLSSPEKIWTNMISKKRNHIRKAQKSDIKIKHSTDPALFKEFMRMYNEVMQKNEASSYYYFKEAFYASIHQYLQNHYRIFYALLGEEIIAMCIFLHTNKLLHSHLLCSSDQYKRYASSNLLLYEAACWGSGNQMKAMHLGGGVGYQEDSLFRFKQSFNPNTDSRGAIGTNIYNQEIYDFLTYTRKGVVNDYDGIFFPSYRH